MISILQKLLFALFQRVEAGFEKIFDDGWNPFYHLGALSFYFFWILGVSGLYLYIFFETSIFGAYNSIEALTHEQWFLGGVMRSLHRYCSDAMAITVTLHLLREFAMGRYNGKRWFSWITGVPLLWFMFAAAIGGYWLVWDQFAQYVAVVTMEWMDWLPTFGDPMARNFLTNENVSDRFFSLMVFLHIGIPLGMMLVMFIHISRVAKAKSNPPKGLAIGTLLSLTLLSLIKPALSAQPADLAHTQMNLPFDWFYLNIYPLIDSWGSGYVWLLVVGFSTWLTFLPWMKKAKPAEIASVDPDHCNGCGWCDLDCPYGAIDFVPHPDGKHARLAVVDPDKCTSCGICTGSCPTATPFQKVDTLQSGIQLPDFGVEELKRLTHSAAEKLAGEGRVIVYGCDMGAKVAAIEKNNTTAISLPCIGFLPPSFVDYILRKNLADGVLVTGCCTENCYFRTGNQWVEERLQGERKPHLRTSFAKSGQNVHLRWAGALANDELDKEIDSFRRSLINQGDDKPMQRKSPNRLANLIGQGIVYSLFVLFIGYFSTSPSFTRVPEGMATVKLSLRHTGQIIGECHLLSDEELARLPPNMRQAKVCPRERSSVEFLFLINGEKIFHEVVAPAGLNSDGRAKLYHRTTIKAGEFEVTAKLKDHRDLADYNYQETKTIKLESGNILVVDFDPELKQFIFIGSSLK